LEGRDIHTNVCYRGLHAAGKRTTRDRKEGREKTDYIRRSTRLGKESQEGTKKKNSSFSLLREKRVDVWEVSHSGDQLSGKWGLKWVLVTLTLGTTQKDFTYGEKKKRKVNSLFVPGQKGEERQVGEWLLDYFEGEELVPTGGGPRRSWGPGGSATHLYPLCEGYEKGHI